jgi:dipeptidyl aminopeptidase/acylaminoacyl peptidase
MKKHTKHFVLFFAAALFAVFSLYGQQRLEKRPLTHDDYDSWKSIASSTISADGNWVLYLEVPQDGDAVLVVKNLKTEKEYGYSIGYTGEGTESHRAARPQFSYDSTHVVFLISPSKAEVKEPKKKKEEEKEEAGGEERANEKKKEEKPKKKLGIMDLSNGEVTVIERIKSYQMPEEAGGWVAYLKEAPPEEEKKVEEKKAEEKKEEEKKKEEKPEEKREKEKKKKEDYGTQFVIRSLADGGETQIEDVFNYRFTKNGKYLLFVISSKEKPETDGVYSLLPGDESGTPLLAGKGKYKNWAMDEEESVLAFLTDRDDQDADEPTFNLYGWKVGDAKAVLWVSHKSTAGIPEGMAVSDKSDISFSNDGKVVLFGIKEIPEPKQKDEKEEGEEEGTADREEEKAKFDLWHWNDPYPQPQQKKMADEVRNNTWESVYHIDTKSFVKLADEDIPDVSLSYDGKIAWAQTVLPYTKLISWDGTYNDIYIVDPKKGEKSLVKKRLYGYASLSPNGKYITWFEDGDWHAFDTIRKSEQNLTKGLKIKFEIEDWDTPNPARPYGIAGWTDNDESVLVYDRYDIWTIKPDGSEAHRITEGFGRDMDLSYRYIRLDPKERTIDPKKTILLRATNQETMAQGFYHEKVQGDKNPELLLLEDKYFGYPEKAKNAERLLFTRMSFEEYPDLWVSDLDLKKPEKITDLGRQMTPFIWGKAELRDFRSSDGKPLKGILIKPENFDPKKKYPLMVYIYETLHNMYHYFRNPSPGTSINPAYYVSNGYVLWMPDIEYGTGYPGRDALKCVLPGIQMLTREGYIDPKAIGIQGHSWGGYQIAYMVTQTDIFAAVEAGAPVSDMVSAYGGIRWGSGMVREFQYERTQSRLGDSLWKVPFRYIENSPIFWADKVQTPILMIHNDQDGAVPWYQGIEYIMALRRLGKEAYMFNYNGEDHGLRKRINQKDWTRRMQEFFDHHLKGEPAPDWMIKGIKAWEKEEEAKK